MQKMTNDSKITRKDTWIKTINGEQRKRVYVFNGIEYKYLREAKLASQQARMSPAPKKD
ncbi:MAG TPA: hypothetical protein PK205_07085 [Promineifilum sp.]|nr:hypothetical protein [Promineifilum sp.]